MRVNLLHAERRLLVVVRFETIVSLAIDALHVHLHSLNRVLRMLVTVGCLLIQLLGVVLAVLLCRKHVTEEATFECLVGFHAQLRSLHEEIDIN